jgi:hypothetical protein
VAALLAEVQRQYLYRRDEGGFGGWVENRLNMSRSLAYGLLNVHKQFGGQSVQTLDTLTHSSMLLLAAPSTPEAARTEVSEQAKKGKVSHKQVKATVAKHKPGPKRGWKHESYKTELARTKAQSSRGSDKQDPVPAPSPPPEQTAEERKRQYAEEEKATSAASAAPAAQPDAGGVNGTLRAIW